MRVPSRLRCITVLEPENSIIQSYFTFIADKIVLHGGLYSIYVIQLWRFSRIDEQLWNWKCISSERKFTPKLAAGNVAQCVSKTMWFIVELFLIKRRIRQLSREPQQFQTFIPTSFDANFLTLIVCTRAVFIFSSREFCERSNKFYIRSPWKCPYVLGTINRYCFQLGQRMAGNKMSSCFVSLPRSSSYNLSLGWFGY